MCRHQCDPFQRVMAWLMFPLLVLLRLGFFIQWDQPSGVFFLGLTRYMFIEVRFKGGVFFHVGYLMVPLHFLLTACKRKRNPQIFSKINIWKCVIKLLDCILSSGEKFIPWSKPKPVILASLFRKWQSSLSIEMIGQWGLWNEPVSLVATCLKSEIRPLLLFWG